MHVTHESRGGHRSSGHPLRLRQTVLDSTDHRRHAEFYRDLLGLDYVPGNEPGQVEEPRFIELVEPATGYRLAFQVDHGFLPPDWPDHQRAPTQAHIDIDVPAAHLDEALDRATTLGARVLSSEERHEGMVVLADPAGHPFCFLITD